MTKLAQLLDEVRGCDQCKHMLPLGPRPLVQAGHTAALIIIGQAPGVRAHQGGVPWDDASGARLRDWMGIEKSLFYDVKKVALMPMGFCYPGTGTGGDMPPRPECAPRWHVPILDSLPSIELKVLIGRYAIDYYTERAYRTLTDAVRDYATLLPNQIALPHPSPRNNRWLKRNPWFEEQTLPLLKNQIRSLLKD